VDEDTDGHGTHCAGTIFGQDVDGQRIGIARGVREPLIGKVLGSGGGDSESIFRAIDWARQKGAHVVSMSLGIDFTVFREKLVTSGFHPKEATSVALQAYRDNVRTFDALSKLFAKATDIHAPLLIAAAGNESEAPKFDIATAPPAAADDILSVGALTQNIRRASFSNTLPDCVAPGVDIVSASLHGGVIAHSGTSMATPHVAGIAVVKAAELANEGPFAPNVLRERVMALAQVVPGETRLTVGQGRITL
jgi:subtilisin family serine protease